MSRTPLIEMKYTALSSKDTAKAIFKITHVGNSRNDRPAIANLIRAKLNNQLEPVEGTFKMVASDMFSETLMGTIRVIRQSIPFVEGQTKGFQSFASNMFMDSEKNIWSLKETASGQLLVQTSSLEDDTALSALLSSYSSVSSNPHDTKRFSMLASADTNVEGGDLAYFVDKNADTKVGYVVASVVSEGKPTRYMVIAHDASSSEIIEGASVLEKLDASDAPKVDAETSMMHSILASTSSKSVDDMLEYYKAMFKRSPAYYEMFEQRLIKSAVI